jgi:tetratricopeptide (TPR) repeat protein
MNGTFLYEKANQWNDALRLLNQLESKVGTNEELSLQKEQVYLRMGKIDLAANELEKLITANPSEIRYYGMLAELYEANNQTEKAMQAYDRLMKISPGDGRGYVAIAQFYFRKNDYPNFITNLEKALNSKELDATMKIGMIGLLIQKASTDSTKLPDALHMSNLLVQNNSSDSRSYAIRGDVFIATHHIEEAMNDYKKSINIEPKEYAVWQQLFFTLSDLKKNDSLESYSSKAIELFPEQALSYYFNGFANSQLKNYTKAIKNLKRGIPMCGDNTALQSQFYASLGDTYHSMKQNTESDSAYEKALSLKPDDAFVMNNYAYYLSCRNINLERAELLSKKSNVLQPKNNSFQDTYGWILFQQKKYTEAKEWVEKAFNNGAAQNPTILEHLGDIYFYLNDVNKAVDFWQQAKKSGSKNVLLDKKITEKKYFENNEEEQ